MRDSVDGMDDLYRFRPSDIVHDSDSLNAGMAAIARMVHSGKIDNLTQLLPFLFTLKGAPLTLNEHFPMECMHDIVCPPRAILKTARQVSKSTSMAIQTILRSVLRPHTHTIFVAPLFEQTRRYSESYVRPLLHGSHFRGMLTGEGFSDDVLRKSYSNGSRNTFTYAYLDADRTRGLDGDILCFVGDTPVSMADGTEKRIRDVVVGDLVLAHSTTENKLHPRMVTAWIPQGVKPVWTVTTSRCVLYGVTDTQRLWSKNNEWKTVSELRASIDSGATATVTWIPPGGWKPECLQGDGGGAPVSLARTLSGGVRGVQVRNSEVHRGNSTKDRPEWRVRGLPSPVHDTGAPGAQRDACAALRDWKEARDAGAGTPEQREPGGSREDQRRETRAPSVEEIEILSIEYAGEELTYDITVEVDHNFIVHGGVKAHNCLDELQDIDSDFLPVIESALAASKLHLINMSGTPKTSENLIHTSWLKSSQGEWVIPCSCCGNFNVMCLEMDLEKCIGPDGLICAKCEKPINSREGKWYHFQQSKLNSFPGWHIPQVILPLHYDYPQKWAEIIHARNNWPRYRYLNEVLGETCDVGSRLVTLEDWRAACEDGLGYDHDDLSAASAVAGQYSQVVMGIDWGLGGGGAAHMRKGKLVVSEGTPSYTAVAVVGFKNDMARPHLLFSEVLGAQLDPRDEMRRIRDIYIGTRCQLVAHDYGGAGFHREQMLRDIGIPGEQTLPMTYTAPSPLRPIVFPQPANDQRFRWSYMVDKTRSLSMTCKILQKGMLKGPRYTKEFEVLAQHFLALVETRATSRFSNDTVLIQQNPSLPSDFAHALNFAMCGAWHGYRVYPAMTSVFGEALAGMSTPGASHVLTGDDDDDYANYGG